MLIEQFLENKKIQEVLRNALSSLSRINFFGVMLEVAAKRSQPLPSNFPMENAALRASWHNGYTDALADVYNFLDRYKIEPVEEVKLDFGALDRLLQTNEITQEEYDRLNADKRGN